MKAVQMLKTASVMDKIKGAYKGMSKTQKSVGAAAVGGAVGVGAYNKVMGDVKNASREGASAARMVKTAGTALALIPKLKTESVKATGLFNKAKDKYNGLSSGTKKAIQYGGAAVGGMALGSAVSGKGEN